MANLGYQRQSDEVAEMVTRDSDRRVAEIAVVMPVVEMLVGVLSEATSPKNLGFSEAPDPVIRPVVDLSEVEKSRSQIDNILGEHTTGISSVSMALTPKPADFRSGNSPYTDPSRSSTTFIQNNYSPKALDPTTVYRQTRNLISVSKSGA